MHAHAQPHVTPSPGPLAYSRTPAHTTDTSDTGCSRTRTVSRSSGYELQTAGSMRRLPSRSPAQTPPHTAMHAHLRGSRHAMPVFWHAGQVMGVLHRLRCCGIPLVCVRQRCSGHNAQLRPRSNLHAMIVARDLSGSQRNRLNAARSCHHKACRRHRGAG